MINGTLNLLKACLKSKSVKRVVFTSSISTISAKDSNGEWRPIVDESSQNPIDHVWNTKASGWVQMLLSFFLSFFLLFLLFPKTCSLISFKKTFLYHRLMCFQSFLQRNQHLNLPLRMVLILSQ